MRPGCWLLLLCLVAGSAAARTPAEAIDAAAAINRQARAAQQRIDSLAGQRHRVLEEIRLIELDGTANALLNRELRQEVTELKQSLADIDTDLRAVTETQTGIISLTAAMIDSLERFIELDLPFMLPERRAAVTRLRENLGRSDLSVSEKYSSVVAAYLDEIRYGHSNGVHRHKIGSRYVDVLRLGRAGLWFVTAGGTEAGRWDRQQHQWVRGDTNPESVLAAIEAVRDSREPPGVLLPLEVDAR